MKIVAVHGFLGLASDWSHLPMPIEAYDLWKSVERLGFANRENAFQVWAKQFTADIRAKGEPVALIGYSLGGRLAMHALLEAPELFDCAIIVSAHPGLHSEHEKRDRIAFDKVWSERFLKEPWPALLKAWNGQPVLAPPQNPPADFVTLDRQESAFNRETLAFALGALSLGRQKDLRGPLMEIECPIRFVTGAQDSKFTSLLADFASRARAVDRPLDHQVVDRAGHRVPWDAPAGFSQALADFLEG